MIANMNEYKGKRLVAAVAVLALVLCAFVAFTPVSDATAIGTESDVPAGTAIPDNGVLADDTVYKITDTEKITSVTLPGSALTEGITLYVADGCSVQIKGATGSTGNVTIYAANADATKYYGTNDTTLVISNFTAGTIQVTADYGSIVNEETTSSSLYVSSVGETAVVATFDWTMTADNDVNGIVAVAPNSTIKTTTAIADVLWGLQVFDGTNYTAYPEGYSATAPVVIDAASETVIVKDASVTVQQKITATEGVDAEIQFTNVKSSAGVTVTGAASQPTISGGDAEMTGTISISSGTASSTGLTLGEAMLNAYASKNVTTSGSVIGATPAVAGATQSGNAWVVSGALVIYGEQTGDFIISKEKVTTEGTAPTNIYLMANSVLNGSISIRGMDSTTVLGTVTIIDGTINAESQINFGGEYIDPVDGSDSAYLQATGGSWMEDVVITGDLRTGALTILSEQIVEFSGNGKLTSSDKVVVLGQLVGTPNGQITATAVQASDLAYVKQFVSSSVADSNITGAATTATADDFVDKVNAGYKDITLTLTKDLTLTNGSLDLTDVKLTVSGNYDIIVGEKYTLSFTESTLRIADNTVPQIMVNNGASIEIVESNLFIEVIVAEGATVSSVGNTATADNITGDINVGFAAVQTLSGTVPKDLNVYVWGTLIVPEGATLTINENATLQTKSGADIQVDGTLNISGIADIVADAEMTVSETGAVNINGSNGNSQLNNAGKVVVDGSITVGAANADRPVNILDAGADFTLNGTMAVNGALKGTVQDKGAITFNGTSNSATIVVYDGVTLTVSSVKNGLTVTDKDIVKDTYWDKTINAYRANVYVSDGNQITLTDVRGVTISEVVTDQVRSGVRYVECDMYISGTATYNGTVDDNTAVVAIAVAGSPAAYKDGTYQGQVHVDSALVLSQGIQMTNSQNITVGAEGSITATAKNAAVTNSGDITVLGTITFSDKSVTKALAGDVNAVWYKDTNDTDGTFILTYTNFAAALGAIQNADDYKITALGTNHISETATLANSQKLDVQGTIVIDEGVTFTVANGGKVSGNSSAQIKVEGTYTVENFNADNAVRDIVAEVLIDNEPARTYTTLANAIAIGETEITIIGEVSITENLVIPDGVTVNSDYPVHVRENVTLTVEGTLNVSAKGSLDNEPTKEYDSETESRGDMTVSGTVAVAGIEIPVVSTSILYQVDGAHYSKTVGATTTYYVTGIDIAAANVDNTIDNMTITVYGNVSATEALTFATPSNADSLTIVVADVAAADRNTVVSVGTITLDGATLQLDRGVSFTGTVSAAAAGATASVDMDKAAGVTVYSVEIEDAEGTTDYMVISGQIEGTVGIAAGTVTVSKVNDGALAAGTLTANVAGTVTTSVLNIESGATLSVPQTGTLSAGMTGNAANETNAPAVNVDGTLDVVKGKVTVTYGMTVNGTMNVAESGNNGVSVNAPSTSGTVKITPTLEILGTMNISAEKSKEGKVNVYGTIVVGSKPTALGAQGTIVGETTIAANTGIVKVYAGTVGDVKYSGQDADSTVFYINGVLYMTVYGVSSNNTIGEIMAGDDIELSGLTTPVTAKDFKFWTDEAMTNEIGYGVALGTYEAVYTQFEPSTVKGVVTVGAGVNLYIDGVQVTGYGDNQNIGTNLTLAVGTHKVSYEIKAGWDGSSVTLTWNGATIENNSTITVDADMETFTLVANGATNSTGVSDNTGSSDDGMGLTDYLLIILVVLIVVMAIMVALRLMRS